MSAFPYARLASVASRLITRAGMSTTLTRIAERVYDPETGTSVPVPPGDVTQPCVAAVLPIEQRYVNGTTIRADDQLAYVSARSVAEPRSGDQLAWGSKTLTVIQAKNLGPAGIFVLYELIVGLR